MMLKIVKIASVLIVFMGMVSSQNDFKQTPGIKVISYNIWNGFDWGKDVERKTNFIDWVNVQKPDVFALPLEDVFHYSETSAE
jgi:LEA14-like dessication related protein|tara:strand:- start:60 stop:308 length:249 start_codon:yes stop_codon:yes gene_type:complete